MVAMPIDTLTIARELRAAEIPTAHAEAIAAAIGSSARGSVEDVATKADIAHLETKLEAAQVKLIMWFVGTQIAFVAIVAAMIKL